MGSTIGRNERMRIQKTKTRSGKCAEHEDERMTEGEAEEAAEGL